MDNMSPKNTFRVFKDILDICIILIPLMADMFSLVSLFLPDMRSWINNKISNQTCIAIIILLNVIMIIGFVYIYDKQTHQKINEFETIVDKYNEIIAAYEDNISDYEKSCENMQTINDLYIITAQIMKTLIDQMKEVLHEITHQKVRVCIKAFAEKYDTIDLHNMELITFCRSDKDLLSSGQERCMRVRLEENTDFLMIMSNNTSYPYFAYNGLTTFTQKTGMTYMNSSSDWEKKYNATIVHPICKCVKKDKSGKKEYQILGFLCIDSLSTKAFTQKNANICISFNKAMAVLLYRVLNKCITQREVIEKTCMVGGATNA